MVKRALLFTAFNGGEWDPELHGRADLAGYPGSCAHIRNMIPMAKGGAHRRPGTYDMGPTRGNAPAVLQRFVFSDSQAYILELTAGKLRLWLPAGLVLTAPGGPALEVDLPYAADELDSVQMAQSADVIFLTHINHQPRMLKRLGATSWALETLVTRDGPYRDILPGQPAMTVEAVSTTSAALTAAAPVFTADMVGQCIRLLRAGQWYWVRLTSVSGPIDALGHVDAGAWPLPAGETTDPGGDEPPVYEPATWVTADYRLPAWGGVRGWPRAVTFYEDRLSFAGSKADALGVWASRSGDYPNFAPTEQDGKVLDDNAITLTIQDDRANPILWLRAARVLVAGTASVIHIIQATNQGDALTPANKSSRPVVDTGSAPMPPIRVDGAMLYLRRDGRAVHELAYSVDADAFVSPDLSELATHLLRVGVRAMAWQAVPWRALWVVRQDGRLAALTYLPGQKVYAWSRHVLGGGGKALSVATIPTPDGDELWMVVERQIGGTVTRRMERMAPRFLPILDADTDEPVSDAARDAYFVDAGVTVTGTGLTSVSALDHLEGQTVSILADGVVFPPRQVTGGMVTLDRPATLVHVGLPYPFRLETLDLDGGGPSGTGQLRPKMVTAPAVRFYASLNARIGAKRGTMETLPARRDGDRMDAPARLFNGWRQVVVGAGWDDQLRLVIEGDDPLPCAVVAVTVTLTTNEA